ncbi:MAG: small multi-drug export protein [Fibrobacterota bacterium]
MELQTASRADILSTFEGKLLAVSLGLITLTLTAAGLLFLVDATLAKTVFSCIGFNLVGGRAPGVGVFIFNDYSPPLAIAISVWVEFVIVVFCYSIFVLTLKNYIRIAWVSRLIHDAEQAAHKNQATIQKYGWLGLMIFVLIPLPLTGPLMGSYIGYFLRFGFIRNFSAVTLGTALAVSLWAYLFEFMEKNLHIFQKVFLGLVCILLIVFFPKIIHFIKYLVRVIRMPHHPHGS